MNLSDVAKVWLKAAAVAYPEPVTISPKTKPETVALLELRERDLIEQYDMWPNGDRRWLVTPAGRAALPQS
jgi:hypothetical protein